MYVQPNPQTNLKIVGFDPDHQRNLAIFKTRNFQICSLVSNFKYQLKAKIWQQEPKIYGCLFLYLFGTTFALLWRMTAILDNLYSQEII